MSSPEHRFVIVEYPHGGQYEKRVMTDVVKRGEIPLPGAALLEEKVDYKEREAAAGASLVLGELAAATVVYLDTGITPEMKVGIQRAELQGRPVEERRLTHQPPIGAWE